MWLKTARTTSEADSCPKDTQGPTLNCVGAYEPSMGPAVDFRFPCSDNGGAVTTLSTSECVAYLLSFIHGALSEGHIDEELASDLAASVKQHYKFALRTGSR